MRELHGGANRSRTGDLLRAKQALSHLSYGPCPLSTIQSRFNAPTAVLLRKHSLEHHLCTVIIGRWYLVGLGRFELPTSPLSGVRSNRLSYRPAKANRRSQANCVGACEAASIQRQDKEVIQPQVPLRLPCYDFTPVMNHTVVSALPKVKQPTSGTAHSHGMTGGVYKARERIHRSMLICDY